MRLHVAKTFEQCMSELEQLIERLESGNIELEEALKTYEKGMKLSSQCQKTLKQAEERIAKLQPDANNDFTE